MKTTNRAVGIGLLAFSLYTQALYTQPNSAHGQDLFDLNEADRMMGYQAVELRDQLIFGLRTFRPDQQAFVDHVIAKVEAGELPRSMVNVVFVWARKRNPRVPFPYFEIALRLLAERRGVILPESGSVVVATE